MNNSTFLFKRFSKNIYIEEKKNFIIFSFLLYFIKYFYFYYNNINNIQR